MPSPISKLIVSKPIEPVDSLSADEPLTDEMTVESISEAAIAKNATPLYQRITWKRAIYHPLTWLALGIHVALLVVPFNPAPPVAIEPEEANSDDAIAIDLLNLSDIATSVPPPVDTPPPPTDVPSAPSNPAQVPASIAVQSKAVQPEAAQTAQAPAVQPDPTSQNAEPVQQVPEPASPEPVQQEPVAQTPAYDPSQDQQLFVKNLGQLGLSTYDSSVIGLPGPNEFKEPVNAGFFVNADAPAPGAKSVQQIDKQPSDVFEQLDTSYRQAGITFTPLDNYGGESLYHAATPEGDTLMYFSLVRLKGSTLLVIWQDLPD